jgi:hypothetical protein
MFRSLKSVDEIINSRKGIFVTDCVRVKPPVILNRALGSIVLWDEKQGGSIR